MQHVNGDQLNHQSIISKQVDYLNEDSLAETAQSLKCKVGETILEMRVIGKTF